LGKIIIALTLYLEQIAECVLIYPPTMVKLKELRFVSFLLEVKAEMERVIWPSRREIIKLTLIVIGVSVAVGFFLGGIDFSLAKLAEFFLKR